MIVHKFGRKLGWWNWKRKRLVWKFILSTLINWTFPGKNCPPCWGYQFFFKLTLLDFNWFHHDPPGFFRNFSLDNPSIFSVFDIPPEKFHYFYSTPLEISIDILNRGVTDFFLEKPNDINTYSLIPGWGLE